MKRLLVITAMLLAFTQPAHAYFTTEHTLKMLTEGGAKAIVVKKYLGGIAEAYWVTSAFGSDVGKSLICFPESQSFQTEELLLLAELSLKKHLNSYSASLEDQQLKAEALRSPVAMVLNLVWSHELPCN